MVKKFIDADMGLADDITDRALDAHKAELAVRRASASRLTPGASQGKRLPRSHHDALRSNQDQGDGAKTLWADEWRGEPNRHRNANQSLHRCTAEPGGLREAPKQALSHSRLHMRGMINCLGRDKLAGGSNADDQLVLMQSKGAKAAELLGLHKIPTDMQPSNYIISYKRIMSAA